MGVIARRIAAVPVRTATATWDRISELLTADTSAERQRLNAIRDIAAILVTEEYTAEAPIIVSPAHGDQIRIYTLHAADALGCEGSEAQLASWPLSEPGWTISLPCGPADLPNLRSRIGGHDGFSLRDVSTGTSLSEESTDTTTSAADSGRDTGSETATRRPIRVNFEEVRQP